MISSQKKRQTHDQLHIKENKDLMGALTREKWTGVDCGEETGVGRGQGRQKEMWEGELCLGYKMKLKSKKQMAKNKTMEQTTQEH